MSLSNPKTLHILHLEDEVETVRGAVYGFFEDLEFKFHSEQDLVEIGEQVDCLTEEEPSYKMYVNCGKASFIIHYQIVDEGRFHEVMETALPTSVDGKDHICFVILDWFLSKGPKPISTGIYERYIKSGVDHDWLFWTAWQSNLSNAIPELADTTRVISKMESDTLVSERVVSAVTRALEKHS